MSSYTGHKIDQIFKTTSDHELL